MDIGVAALSGAIDCDVHPAVPDTGALLPYLQPYWREHILRRGLERDNLETSAFPAGAPINARPDWRLEGAPAGSSLAALQAQLLDPMGTRLAICNVLHGAQMMMSEDLSAALCRAINDWLAAEFLDRDPRLRASIVVPVQNPHYAAAEIERWAGDRRFVQVLLLGMGEMLLGRRYYWPLYQAATRHDLPIGIHAGSAYRHAPTSGGWPSHITQDSVNQTAGFEGQLLSLMAEGVFLEYPQLRVVLMESGISWLPPFIWRAIKSWRGLRTEAPWMRRSPGEFVRAHVRLTLQPFDAPGADEVERIVDQIGSDDVLLYSSDYPHWHFDGAAAIPEGLSSSLVRKICFDNPRATYTRLKETVA